MVGVASIVIKSLPFVAGIVYRFRILRWIAIELLEVEIVSKGMAVICGRENV